MTTVNKTRTENKNQKPYTTTMDKLAKSIDVEMNDTNCEKLLDLSHTIEDGLITYKGLPAPIICDYLSICVI